MIRQLFLIFCINIFLVRASPTLGGQHERGASQHPDIDKTLVEIITSRGYPLEEHFIETKDDYILKIFRIPHGVKCPTGDNKPVAWIQHGMLGSASDFTHNTLEKALVYRLADACYDVFLGNARGNRYSRGHKTLNADTDAEYWKFSWHEMGVFDFPAMVDFALELTGQESLFWIGHSMGSTEFFIGASMHPSYNSKIRAMFGLGPAAYLDNMPSSIRGLAPLANDLEQIIDFVGINEFLPTSRLMELLGKHTCSETSPIQELCTNIAFLLNGYNPDQLNTTQLPVMLQHFPSGTSARGIIHYAQLINAKDFVQFNHGPELNLQVYGQDTPPVYPLDKITCPVALFYSSNDVLIAEVDAERLAAALPNPIPGQPFLVTNPSFTHLDFAIGIDADTLIYNRMMEIMEQY